MDIQSVSNEYEAATYMSYYFSKNEDQCSKAMKKAVKETFDNNMHNHDSIKIIAKVYLTNGELKLKRIFLIVVFNTNLLGQRVQVSVSIKTLQKNM